MSMFTVIRGMMVVMTLLAPGLAHAYVGPGAGLSAIGAVLAFIGATLLLIVGFVWYPIKRLLKRLKGNRPQPESGTNPSTDSKSK